MAVPSDQGPANWEDFERLDGGQLTMHVRGEKRTGCSKIERDPVPEVPLKWQR